MFIGASEYQGSQWVNVCPVRFVALPCYTEVAGGGGGGLLVPWVALLLRFL